MRPVATGASSASQLAFYQELKVITQPHHTRLEASIPLLDPLLSLATYHDLLRQFYGIYAALHEAIDGIACEPLAFSPSVSNQTEWLQQDLCALGEDGDRLAAIPRCSELPSLSSRAKLLGALYVINGATLGSQFIVSCLRTSLGAQAQSCTRFFHSYGDQVKPRWLAFLEVLVRAPETPQEQRAIIESACDTFDCFERWFGQRAGPMRNRDAARHDRMIVR